MTDLEGISPPDACVGIEQLWDDETKKVPVPQGMGTFFSGQPFAWFPGTESP